MTKKEPVSVINLIVAQLLVLSWIKNDSNFSVIS